MLDEFEDLKLARAAPAVLAIPKPECPNILGSEIGLERITVTECRGGMRGLLVWFTSKFTVAEPEKAGEKEEKEDVFCPLMVEPPSCGLLLVVFSLATLLVMIIRRDPLKIAPDNSLKRYIGKLAMSIRRMALRPLCFRRIDKEFLLSLFLLFLFLLLFKYMSGITIVVPLFVFFEPDSFYNRERYVRERKSGQFVNDARIKSGDVLMIDVPATASRLTAFGKAFWITGSIFKEKGFPRPAFFCHDAISDITWWTGVLPGVPFRGDPLEIAEAQHLCPFPLFPMIDILDVANITGVLDEVRPYYNERGLPLRRAETSWDEGEPIAPVSVVNLGSWVVEGTHFPAKSPAIARNQLADERTKKSVLEKNKGPEELFRPILGPWEYHCSDTELRNQYAGIQKRDPGTKYSMLSNLNLRLLGSKISRRDANYIPADVVCDFATLIIMLIRRDPLKRAPDNSLTRYVKKLATSIRKMALRPQCFRRVDKQFLFSQNQTLKEAYEATFPQIEVMIHSMALKSFVWWIRKFLPSCGAMGLWATAAPQVKYYLGKLGHIPGDIVSTAEFRRILMDEMDWVWSMYMRELYTHYLEVRVARGEGIPPRRYPEKDNRLRPLNLGNLSREIPYFEWVPLKAGRRQLAIIDPLHQEYAVCEGEAVSLALRSGDSTRPIGLVQHAPLIVSPERSAMAFAGNLTAVHWLNPTRKEYIEDALRTPADVISPFTRMTGLPTAPLMTANFIQEFWDEYQKVYAPRTPATDCGVCDDFGLGRDLDRLRQEGDTSKTRKTMQTLCRRHVAYKLFRHNAVLFDNPLVLAYYVAFMGWDGDSVLQNGGGLTSVDPFWLPKLVTNKFGYVPEAVQEALLGKRYLPFGPRRAQGSVSFPELLPDVMVSRVVEFKWDPTQRAHRPKLNVPDTSLMEFLVMTSKGQPN